MSKVLHYWYTLAMSYYDIAFDIASENHGIVTSAAALKEGIPRKVLVRLAREGRLIHVGYGVYRFDKWVPMEWDEYAEAVALVGSGSFVWGQSVLAMHRLALVLPGEIEVGNPRRVRRALPPGVRVVRVGEPAALDFADGIPTQTVADAIRTCRGAVMAERLLDAVSDAERQGLVTRREAEKLREELRCRG